MELKKLIKAYLTKSTPLKSVTFLDNVKLDPSEMSPLDNSDVNKFMEVRIEWLNEMKKDVAIPVTMSGIEAVHFCYTVTMEFYDRQMTALNVDFVKRHKLGDTPSLIVPNDLSIIN